jgi:rhamnose utilization protein RhaD (predicted bifunctional aldolase and dehydrogenase)/NAD(P)-dependent dehydrogenase (short-subunit alcohol dehydrogenase family)
VKSRWSQAEAEQYGTELELRAYSSRLLGADRELVMHGGGNTSLKTTETDLLGEEEDILWVKGSGWDLASIQPAGFAPVRLDRLIGLSRLESLSDLAMARELRAATVDPAAPDPSVEAILHAILPHRFVDHTHAGSVVAITNTRDGRQRIEELYGDLVAVVPYVMPGFELARVCAELVPDALGPGAIGLVLLNHGVFSFGDTAQESYERMIRLVATAEDYLERKAPLHAPAPGVPTGSRQRVETAELRSRVAAAAGFPVVLERHTDPRSLEFARRDDVAVISQQGPATPDHVLRTKRVPLVGRDVDAYSIAYRDYVAENANGRDLTPLDPAPRIVLDPELGLCAIGRTPRAAGVAADLYRHTIDVILRATALGGYEALPAADVFAVEYWDLEQAKLRREGDPPPFSGEVALVTGGGSGIGKACVEALLAQGAAVVALDIDPAVETMRREPAFLGQRCDVTDLEQIDEALERAVERYGGLDILVLNAGAFPPTRRIEALDAAEWRFTLALNLDHAAFLMREAHPLLERAPGGGRVVVVGSKNVPAPGPGAAAYSVSKAALTQLVRVAALEWGGDGIRVYAVHPNAVFDTGIWTDEVLAERAASYGLSVAEYKRKNVLGVEITSRDVGELVAALCGPAFARTTGAQIPVDGGNDRVI